MRGSEESEAEDEGSWPGRYCPSPARTPRAVTLLIYSEAEDGYPDDIECAVDCEDHIPDPRFNSRMRATQCTDPSLITWILAQSRGSWAVSRACNAVIRHVEEDGYSCIGLQAQGYVRAAVIAHIVGSITLPAMQIAVTISSLNPSQHPDPIGPRCASARMSS